MKLTLGEWNSVRNIAYTTKKQVGNVVEDMYPDASVFVVRSVGDDGATTHSAHLLEEDADGDLCMGRAYLQGRKVYLLTVTPRELLEGYFDNNSSQKLDREEVYEKFPKWY